MFVRAEARQRHSGIVRIVNDPARPVRGIGRLVQVVVHAGHLHISAGRGIAIRREFRAQKIIADRLDRHGIEGGENRRRIAVVKWRHLPFQRHVLLVIGRPERIHQID